MFPSRYIEEDGEDKPQRFLLEAPLEVSANVHCPTNRFMSFQDRGREPGLVDTIEHLDHLDAAPVIIMRPKNCVPMLPCLWLDTVKPLFR